MAVAAAALSLGAEFDAFLLAPIGEEKNGMLLSVLSALARLDIDPWREAAELAHLPMEAANQRLACLIEAMPDGPPAGLEAEMISARLVALLPREARLRTASGEKFPEADVAPGFRAFILVVLLNLLIIAGMTGAERVVTRFHADAAPRGPQTLAASPGAERPPKP